MDAFSEIIQIGDFKVGHNQPVFIIAEAGVAHFGSLEKAMQLVDMAVEAKADAVKFQIFITDELISPVSEEWRNRLRTKELDFDSFKKIKAYCQQQGIMFLATAHDQKSFDFLLSLDVPAFKVGSGELDNFVFLETIFKHKKPVILSTGLHNKQAIAQVVQLALNCSNPDLILLHCNTAYPTAVEESHLKSIWWMRDQFKTQVGYSDHTVGMTVPLAAVALGASVVEKHICLDKTESGSQDCYVALEANELIEFVRAARQTQAALGEYGKQVIEAAKLSVLWARKSLVLACNKQAGQVLKQQDLCIKRPGTGISPEALTQILGQRLQRDVLGGQLLTWDDLECQTDPKKSAS